MTETGKALEILKTRWREVVLIIALDILSLSINMTQTIFNPIGKPLRILITLVFLTFNIITFTLIFGFQRTVYTEDRKRQSPLVLLREGGHFFLRLAGLGLIYTLLLVYLQFMAFWAIKQIDASFLETRWGTSLIYLALSTSFNLILMKPIILIFPLIIVLDCGIFESFKMLGRCRLRDARELVILFLISIGLSILWAFLPSQRDMTIAYYIITAVRIIVGRFIALMIAVMAIKFVAAQNLIYDSGLEQLDSLDNSI
jgi:hypothetical protein